MNSWDRDTQNSLIIQASDSPNHDKDLEAFAVPKEQPADVTVYLYHSQKPGKWSKRYITLLSTGQIFLSKKAGSKVSDKDIVTICHLTDFDIYTPTPQQLRKSIKPPKKYCHAVKSQQRTAMFLNTDNFVHFFSTDDPGLADKWYDTVQQWRSWYLVHMMGEGLKKVPASKLQTMVVAPEVRARSGSTLVRAHKVKVSVDESPYTIGSFKPLLDLSRFESLSPDREENRDEEEGEDRPRQIPFHLRNAQSPQQRRERHPPPVSLTRHNLPASGNEPITLLSPDDTFSPTGLLGQTYSDRQRAQKERESSSQSNDGPFVPGPSLLNNAALLESARPRTGVDNGHERVFGRSMSMKNQRPDASAGPHHGSLKPLIDLSPKIAEAQQWSRYGKGRGVAAPTGVPLVEAATSLDSALDPIARIRRRDVGNGGGGGAGGKKSLS
jgi:PH domain